jgi:hypothetical protein
MFALASWLHIAFFTMRELYFNFARYLYHLNRLKDRYQDFEKWCFVILHLAVLGSFFCIAYITMRGLYNLAYVLYHGFSRFYYETLAAGARIVSGGWDENMARQRRLARQQGERGG